MENQFTKTMSERSDEQLIKIITSDREKYTDDAIDAAKYEIKKRNIDQTDFNQTVDKINIEKEETDKAEFNSASSILRFVNYLIDIIAGYVTAFIIAMIVTLILPLDFIGFQLAASILVVASFFAYYILMEVIFQKTLGKFVTKTKVVTVNGQKPPERTIVLRTLCRLIPFDHISFLFTKNGFHDNLSKTKVIKDNPTQ